MQCPSCKLENPPSAMRCDCGHRFDRAEVNTEAYLREIARSTESIRRLVLLIIVLGIVAAVIWGVVSSAK